MSPARRPGNVTAMRSSRVERMAVRAPTSWPTTVVVRVRTRPGASNKNVLVVAAVEEGSAPKGSNQIFFELRALNHDKIAVREKTTFFMP